MSEPEPTTLLEAVTKYPSYQLRCYVGGIYFTAYQTDFNRCDIEKFNGEFHIDHGCNEIDLRNKEL